MIRKFISICALALSFLVFVAPTAQAGHCGCDKSTHIMHKAIKKLDLTAEQKDKIKAICDKAHGPLHVKRDEMRNLEMMINASFKDGSITEAKIDEFSMKRMHIVGAIMKIRLMERFEISKVLTDEQKQKLHDMIQDKMNGSCHKS